MIEKKPIQEQPVAMLPFSVRLQVCLKNAGVVTVADITNYRRTDFLKFRNFGRVSLCELDRFMKQNGLQYKP